MMVNPLRGEIAAHIGDKTYTLCLTLGALAELEHAYGGIDLIALAERFETGRISAGDAITVLGAGLRGAGNTVTDEQLAKMTVAGGAVGAINLVVQLLAATFASPESQSKLGKQP